MAKSKTFQFGICNMSPKMRRRSKYQSIRKKSTRCPAGKIVKCSKTKGYGYCGKKTRRSRR